MKDHTCLLDHHQITIGPQGKFNWVLQLVNSWKVRLFVKSIPPTTENWLRKLYKYSMNIDTSIEDKHETNHINIKYNDMNMNTRKMHNI